MTPLQQALHNLLSADLKVGARDLFATLGYESDKTEDGPFDAAGFAQAFNHKFTKGALETQWKRVELLFQLTGDEVNGQLALESDAFNPRRFDSFLFFAVDLEKDSYSRSDLAGMARELNKPFPAPVIVLFRHGQTISLASLHRRVSKRDSNSDVLDRVVLLREIRLEQTHRAHLDILKELKRAVEQARDWNGFLAEWNRVLDISELNRKFYQELSNWYFWAIQNVEFPRPKTDTRTLEEHRAMSVIRLITRLIFVWFIKERDLVPGELFQRDEVQKLLKSLEPDGSSYYKAVLQNLFFATLNTDGTRSWREKRDSSFPDPAFNTHTVWRYKSLFQTPDEAERLFNQVPFLNGGLFRCLDKDVTPKDGGKKLVERFDGFSERDDNPLRVPNLLFWGDKSREDSEGRIAADLNEAYGSKGREYRVRPLLSILESYKFTVAENTPFEEEVALDPELLGKVFENLLASYNPETSTTARKQTGSFYTPRPIVDYLVEESLFAHLSSQVADLAPETWRALLSPEVENNPDLSEAQREAIIEAIHGARVLDPACGSGAFVMGALESMVRLLRKVDKGNQRWKKREAAAIEEARRSLQKIGVPDAGNEAYKTARARFEKAFDPKRDSGDYARKLYLLERCIHGVDIQPVATQIAKLRVFISLAIEQTIDRENPDNFGIESLPNLETKIVAANTLRAFEKSTQLALFDAEIGDIIEAMKGKTREYFTCFRRARKLELETEVEALLGNLGDFVEQSGKDQKANAGMIRGWKFWDQNSFAQFFDAQWMFGEAVRGGFDIIIGNPPYLRVQGIGAPDASYYKKKFQSAKGAFDLYALFIERGYAMLAPGGTLGFIVPHKFFQAAFGESLRKHLTDERALRQIVRFGHAQVFTEATTYTCLLFLSKNPQDKFDLIEIERLDHQLELFKALRENGAHPELARAPFDAPSGTDWDFSLGESNKTLARLQQHPHTLGEITRKIFVGLQTSANDIYVLTEKARFTDENGVEIVRCFSKSLDSEVELEVALTKPFLMGKDIHRYEPPRQRNVVIFPFHLNKEGEKTKADLMTPEWIEQNCPRGWKYLKANEEALAGREKGKMRRPDFYDYVYRKNLTDFATPKIITPDIALGCQMALDEAGRFYYPTTAYGITFKGNYPASQKFLLAILNSKVMWFYLTQKSGVLRGGYFRFFAMFLEPFPLPAAPDASIQALVERLVDYQLHLKSGSVGSPLGVLMATGFSRLLDGLIYELYFPEEFETRLKLSQVVSLDSLPPLPLSDGEIETVFKLHFAPTADARAALFSMDEIEAVRVIEAASPGHGKSGGEK